MSLGDKSTRELIRQIESLKDSLNDVRYRAQWTEIQHDIARVQAELNRRKHGEE